MNKILARLALVLGLMILAGVLGYVVAHRSYSPPPSRPSRLPPSSSLSPAPAPPPAPAPRVTRTRPSRTTLRIISTPPEFANRGETYRYKVRLARVPEQGVAYSLVKGPDGMQIHPNSGLLEWQPRPPVSLVNEVLLMVSQPDGPSVTQNFTVRLNPLDKIAAFAEPWQFVQPLEHGLLVGVTQGRLKIVSQTNVNQIIASYWTPCRVTRSFEFYKGHLYLPSSVSGVEIFDVSSEKEIRLVNHLDVELQEGAQIDLAGDRLFVPEPSKRMLRLFSVAEPASPREIGRHNLAGLSSPWKVKIVDQTAYVLGQKSLSTFDVRDPKAIRPLGQIEIESNISLGAFLVAGSYAYVYAGHEIRIFDVTNPRELSQVKTTDRRTWCSHAVLRGTRAIVYGMNGAYELDLSNPLDPQVVQGHANQFPGNLMVGKELDFTTDARGQVVPAKGSPRFGNDMDPGSGRGWYIVTRDNFCFVIGDRVSVLDVSQPARPKPVVSVPFRGYNYIPRTQVFAEPSWKPNTGHYLFMPNAIVDVSAPGTPRIIQGFKGGKGIGVSGGLAVITQDKSVQFWDVNDPTQPKLLKSQLLEEESGKLFLRGKTLFVAVGPGKLRSYRIEDDYTLVKLSELEVVPSGRGMILDVCCDEDFLYLALNDAGVAVVDIKDPSRLELYSWFDTPQHSEIVRGRKGLAYVADGSGGVLVLDLREKGTGRILARYPTTDWTPALDIWQNYIFASESQNGFSVFQADTLRNIQ